MKYPALPDNPTNLYSWIKHLFSLLGRRPNPRLGQVFLVNKRGIEVFSEKVADLLGYPVAEIGTGPGHLTYYVARRVGGVIGVEVDSELAAVAASVLQGTDSSIVLGDGVRFLSYAKISGYYSNTPYSESSRIISASARNNHISRALLGLQLEVAKRVLAVPGSQDYGRLTLLVNRYFRVTEVGRLPREWFYPRPDVHGSIVFLERVKEWREGDECFEKLTACLFTGRNKLADKMASKCLGLDRALLTRITGKRVRELTVVDVDWLLEKAGGCTIQ
ncbi:MAG: hypothetical protein F7B78_05120 [Desulfurococcales archaeon]|nr:hypothetical protein [Desulfurococcales archaeon]